MTFYYLSAWHGLSQGIITAGAILLALQHWPSSYEWLVVGVSGLVAGIKGIDGYRRDPA